MNLELPRRGDVGSTVETGDAAEVREQIGAERRVHVDDRRDAGRHFLLHQGGVKVPRIPGHQANVGHRRVHQTRSFLTTSPWTSVRRKSRPWKR